MIVVVTGGKGGVGKSTTAWNLGYELDAVVVDADVTGGDLPPSTGPDLHDVLAGRADPLEAVWEVGSVHVVSSGQTLAGARAATLRTFEPVIDRLERAYDRVVVDCPAGLARDVGIALRSGDFAVLVTQPQKSALVDATRTADLAVALETPVTAAVLNMAGGDSHRQLADRMERVFAAPVTVVGSEPAVSRAQSKWLPVREYDPDARATDAYCSLADRLLEADKRFTEQSDVT